MVYSWKVLVPKMCVEERSNSSQLSFTSEFPLTESTSYRYMVHAGGESLYSSITHAVLSEQDYIRRYDL